MVKVAALGLFLVGCASSSNTPKLDGGGGPPNAICPNHPNQCGGMCCGDKCVDTLLDPFNCGGCTMQCMNGELCKGGACGCQPSGTRCGEGQTCCGATGCKSLGSDAFNCGSCGNVCMGGQMCMSGKCACPSSGCVAPPDMAMGNAPDMAGQGGLCQCSDHCAGRLFPICVNTNCCEDDWILMTCNIGSCQANPMP